MKHLNFVLLFVRDQGLGVQGPLFLVGRPTGSNPVHGATGERQLPQLWSAQSSRGWSHERPELRDFLLNLCAMEALCFLADPPPLS